MTADTTAGENALLLVDDDATFTAVLARALERRGFRVQVAHDVAQALALLADATPSHAIVDLKMPGPSGLSLIAQLRARNSAMRIVVLTGYASIATAVEAIKLGATHYLAKPADADEIVAAFDHAATATPPAPPQRLSVDRMEWEYINKVLAECGNNISEAARRLHMHRRTLQRKLSKRPAPR